MEYKKKNVIFNHFKPYFLDESEKGTSSENVYDLGDIFKEISKKLNKKQKVERRIFGERQRFYICKYNSDFKLWEIQILHLRENLLPGIADDQGGYELIKLEDSQYPAESTTILYDEARCILYVQGNHYGTTTNALEMLLQELSSPQTTVILKPFIYSKRIENIKPSNLYRNLLLVVDSEQMSEEDKKNKSKVLFGTINGLKKYGGRFIRINIGFSRQRKGLLNGDEVSQIVHEAYDFNGTQTLKVKTAGSYEEQFDTINLLDDRKTYKTTLNYSRQEPITHDRLVIACLAKYREEYIIQRSEYGINFKEVE